MVNQNNTNKAFDMRQKIILEKCGIDIGKDLESVIQIERKNRKVLIEKGIQPFEPQILYDYHILSKMVDGETLDIMWNLVCSTIALVEEEIIMYEDELENIYGKGKRTLSSIRKK